MAMNETALMYGRSFKRDMTAVNVMIGVSYVKGVIRGSPIGYRNYTAVNISTIGIPLDVELMIGVTRSAALSLLFFGNLNKEKSFGGLSAKLNIGIF